MLRLLDVSDLIALFWPAHRITVCSPAGSPATPSEDGRPHHTPRQDSLLARRHDGSLAKKHLELMRDSSPQ